MSSRSGRSAIVNRFAGAMLVSILVGGIAACSSDGETAAETTTTTTAEAVVSERCSTNEQLTGEPTSDACADAVYAAAIASAGSEELRAVPRARQIALGRTLCALGAALAGEAPTRSFSDLVGANLESWGVSISVADELAVFSEMLCPEDVGPLLALRGDEGPYRVDIAASGPGDIEVVYTLPDGSSATETVSSPFSQSIYLTSLADVKVAVSSESAGDVGCTIVFNNTEVSTAGGDGQTECLATAAQLRSAR